MLYTYSGTIKKVIDPITLYMKIDLGFGESVHKMIEIIDVKFTSKKEEDVVGAMSFLEQFKGRVLRFATFRDENGAYSAEFITEWQGKELVLADILINKSNIPHYEED